MQYKGKFRVKPGKPVDLRRIDPGDTGGYPHKEAACRKLERDIEKLRDAQDVFIASGR
jgi:hypothetical protein